MLRININTQPIRTEYNIQNAKLNIQSIPSQVQMDTKPPVLEISQPRGELTIDHTAYRYSIGLKNIADFARDNAALGKQTVMNTIARIAGEGNQMADIQYKSNVIANIAYSASLTDAPDITWTPISAPDIRYEAYPAKFNATAGKVNYNIQPGKVQGDYHPGKVDIQVVQYPRIEFSTLDVKV